MLQQYIFSLLEYIKAVSHLIQHQTQVDQYNLNDFYP